MQEHDVHDMHNVRDVSWQMPDEPRLLAQEIHIWRASLDQPSSHVEQLTRLLAEDERAKAARFRFAQHRQHFIVARGVLRALLGSYLHIAPQDVLFEYGPYGKPRVASRAVALVPHFNLSHSRDLALYAFSSQSELGIDVEYVQQPFPDALSLAQRFFPAQESQRLQSLPPDEQSTYFFRVWTRIEAMLKAQGVGLSALEQQTLQGVGTDVARPGSHINGQAGRAASVPTWLTYEIIPAPNYAAALVMKQRDAHMVYWEWQPDRLAK